MALRTKDLVNARGCWTSLSRSGTFVGFGACPGVPGLQAGEVLCLVQSQLSWVFQLTSVEGPRPGYAKAEPPGLDPAMRPWQLLCKKHGVERREARAEPATTLAGAVPGHLGKGHLVKSLGPTGWCSPAPGPSSSSV